MQLPRQPLTLLQRGQNALLRQKLGLRLVLRGDVMEQQQAAHVQPAPVSQGRGLQLDIALAQGRVVETAAAGGHCAVDGLGRAGGQQCADWTPANLFPSKP